MNENEPCIQKLGNVKFSYRVFEKYVRLDRVFIPVKLRSKRLLTPALKAFTNKFISDGYDIDASICPDDNSDESYNKLKKSFKSAGYKPLKMDGTTYPAEVFINKLKQ